MSNLVLELPLGFSLKIFLCDDDSMAAHWLWCDLRVGAVEVFSA